jgi:hypothetical protein
VANEEHLHILEQGVNIWNAWRREHSEIRPELSGVDLSVAHLEGADLSGANLSGAKLFLARTLSTLTSAVRTSASRTSAARLSASPISTARTSRARTSMARRFLKLSGTIFADLDLRGVEGIKNLRHRGRRRSASAPSTAREGRYPGNLPARVRRAGRVHHLLALAHGQGHRLLLLLHPLQPRRQALRPPPARRARAAPGWRGRGGGREGRHPRGLLCVLG